MSKVAEDYELIEESLKGKRVKLAFVDAKAVCEQILEEMTK